MVYFPLAFYTVPWQWQSRRLGASQVQVVVVLSPSPSSTVVGTTLGKADPETEPFTTQLSCPPWVGLLEYGVVSSMMSGDVWVTWRECLSSTQTASDFDMVTRECCTYKFTILVVGESSHIFIA